MEWNLTSFSCPYKPKTQVRLIRKFIWPFWLNPRLILCLIHREYLFYFFFPFFPPTWNLTDYDWKLLSLFKSKVQSKFKVQEACSHENGNSWVLNPWDQSSWNLHFAGAAWARMLSKDESLILMNRKEWRRPWFCLWSLVKVSVFPEWFSNTDETCPLNIWVEPATQYTRNR